MCTHQCNDVLAAEPLCAESSQDGRKRIPTSWYAVQRRGDVAVFAADEYWDSWSEGAGGNGLGGGELEHIGDANVVFCGPGLDLLANVREAQIFGTRAFAGED